MSDLPGLLEIAANNTASIVELQPESLAVLLYALGKIDNAKSWRDHWNEYISDADIELIHELVDLAADNIMRPLVIPDTVYQNEFVILGHQFTNSVGNALLPIHLATWDYGFYMEHTTVAINNEMKCSAVLAGGNWNFKFICSMDAASTIVTTKIDGAYEQQIDLYNATSLLNVRSQFGTAIGLGAGLHEFTFKAASKRAASSGYRMRLVAVYGRNNGTLV